MQGLRNLLQLQTAADVYEQDRQRERRIRSFWHDTSIVHIYNRLTKGLVPGIIEEIGEDMPLSLRRSAISVEQKVGPTVE